MVRASTPTVFSFSLLVQAAVATRTAMNLTEAASEKTVKVGCTIERQKKMFNSETFYLRCPDQDAVTATWDGQVLTLQRVAAASPCGRLTLKHDEIDIDTADLAAVARLKHTDYAVLKKLAIFDRHDGLPVFAMKMPTVISQGSRILSIQLRLSIANAVASDKNIVFKSRDEKEVFELAKLEGKNNYAIQYDQEAFKGECDAFAVALTRFLRIQQIY